MIRMLGVALFLAIPTSASAHSFWLEPDTHTPKAGDNIQVEFRVGDIGKEAADWGLYWERIAALRLFGPKTVKDQQRAVRTTQPDQSGLATITAPQAGTHTLAFASNTSFSDFEAQRFNRYLDHQGLSAIAGHRSEFGLEDRNGTELYARRAKALFQIGEETTANVLEPIGQTLEIVPMANPFELKGSQDLPVMVLWRGEPLAGASLMVARGGAEKGKEEVFLTDKTGVTTFKYHPDSRYLLSVVWGEPAPSDTRADYFTIFASLTF